MSQNSKFLRRVGWFGLLGVLAAGCNGASLAPKLQAPGMTPAPNQRDGNPPALDCEGGLCLPTQDKDEDPPEVGIGERLFRETRFNQYFYAKSQGRVNAALDAGDPVLEFLPTLTNPFKNPYAGQGMNCASCHFVDELQDVANLGNRAYNDFARRSPIPDRGDGRVSTLRNSPPFVNSTLALEKDYQNHPLFMHFDGEFATPEDLVRGGFTGRNFGWLADEGPIAIAHLAKVIREDDGQGRLATAYGGAYRAVLAGADESIPAKFRLPEEYRLDVAHASDEQIMGAVGKLVGAYLRSLIYQRDAVTSEFSGSPYDVFLFKNGLPRKPSSGESDLEYARRLARQLELLPPSQIRYVSDRVDGQFKLSKQAFVFGQKELAGLKTFLSEPKSGSEARAVSGAGNCVACHAPPAFTDFGFHNTGATQDEYDAVHGRGSFAQIYIPAFAERISREEDFFGPTGSHPKAKGQFASVPSKDHPGYTDLGVWNVFGNPAIQRPQENIRKMLCEKLAKAKGADTPCDDQAALSMAVAAFKTATVRNLGQSAPYLHTGAKDTLEDVLSFYLEYSALARQGKLRSADPEMARIQLAGDDVGALAAFLRALNEDYH